MNGRKIIKQDIMIEFVKICEVRPPVLVSPL